MRSMTCCEATNRRLTIPLIYSLAVACLLADSAGVARSTIVHSCLALSRVRRSSSLTIEPGSEWELQTNVVGRRGWLPLRRNKEQRTTHRNMCLVPHNQSIIVSNMYYATSIQPTYWNALSPLYCYNYDSKKANISTLRLSRYYCKTKRHSF